MANHPRRQPGIETPSAGDQLSLSVIQLQLVPSANDFRTKVQGGLKELVTLFNDQRTKKPDGEFFTATIGFGLGFYRLLNVRGRRRPRLLRDMPSPRLSSDEQRMGNPVEQSDIVIVLATSKSGQTCTPINPSGLGPGRQTLREVTLAILNKINDWAKLQDVHEGFRRTNHRNMLGFIDGISNPKPGSEAFRDLVWTTDYDESPLLADGTYLAFQKIAHDLDKWQNLGPANQEKWIGRSKGTGLLLGTQRPDKDDLAQRMVSADPEICTAALEEWRQAIADQRDPTKRFYDDQNYDEKCPVWAHVRKANPRAEGGHTWPRVIYRRGCNYVEGESQDGLPLIKPLIISEEDFPGNGGSWPRPLPDKEVARSGVLFLGYQRNLRDSFDYMRSQWMDNPQFPSKGNRTKRQRDLLRKTFEDMKVHQAQEDRLEELLKILEPGLGSVRNRNAQGGTKDERTVKEVLAEIHQIGVRVEGTKTFEDFLEEVESGPEAFSRATRLGLSPNGVEQITFNLGGGYYFVPPLPQDDTSYIDKLFF